MTTTFHGVTIHRCACIPFGTHIYLCGGELLAVSEPERRKFLALFGLHEPPPKGADAIALNPAEADEVLALVRSTTAIAIKGARDAAR
jgi:hypothetical protein